MSDTKRSDALLSESWADQAAVARHLGISERTLEGWRTRGEGPPYARLGKAVRYRLSAVDRWALECQTRSMKRRARLASAEAGR